MPLLKLLLKFIVFCLLALVFLSLFQYGPDGFVKGVRGEIARLSSAAESQPTP